MTQQLQSKLDYEEKTAFRSKYVDTLVHVCLYFIAPSGHR